MSVCLSVCTPPPSFRHDRLTATKVGTHVRIDLGNIQTKTNLTHPTQGGPGGILEDQNSTKVREMSWTAQKINTKINPHPTGSGSFRGKKLKSPGNVMNCWQTDIFLTPGGEF